MSLPIVECIPVDGYQYTSLITELERKYYNELERMHPGPLSARVKVLWLTF